MPTLKGLWPGMVTSKKGLEGADLVAANAHNERVWYMLGNYALADVMRVVEAVGTEIFELPKGKGYPWLLKQIQDRLPRLKPESHSNRIDDVLLETRQLYDSWHRSEPELVKQYPWPGDYQVRQLISQNKYTPLQRYVIKRLCDGMRNIMRSPEQTKPREDREKW